ncbi:PepSY domain-containing protein [uncultured Sphingomonas sp.]|uniref:PepSY domain-containing protein n=1 Tax=uncultured Sphingomonas sp. TaxID=158754 RepID=UPI0035CAFF92
MPLRRPLARVHVWLAWIVGVPLLIWTATGLWMVARPIEEVRGTALRAPAPALPRIGPLVAPTGRPLKSLALEAQGGRAVWIAAFSDGGAARADPATGRWLPGLNKAEARTLARAGLLRPAAVRAVTRTPADRPPIDLRRPRPAWAVTFADGARIYLDADTGALLALRTDQWRLFDWMWGLHIMDLRGREDTSHPVLIGSAALALLAVLLGLLLLPFSTRRR